MSVSRVEAHTCEVGKEIYNGKWMWVLATDNPCECTRIVMGGINTVTPKRFFVPTYVETPLISDNAREIRLHYNCPDQGTVLRLRYSPGRGRICK